MSMIVWTQVKAMGTILQSKISKDARIWKSWTKISIENSYKYRSFILNLRKNSSILSAHIKAFEP